MAELARAVAGLRVIGDDLVPEEIGAAPTKAQRKGEALPSKGGVRTARTGIWRLSAPDTEPADLDHWKSLADRYRIDLFCGWFMREANEGIEVSPTTLRALGDRHIALSLDLYARTESV